LTVASRIPFICKYLFDWDSILLARALDGFYIPAHRPHPPGYIFSVLSAKLLYFIFDANTAYIVLGIFFAAITAIFIWRIMDRFVPTTVAFLAALIWITSPLSWFWSSVSATYIISPAFAALLMWFSVKFDSSRRPVFYSFMVGLTVGIASGFRQDLTLLLGVPTIWFIFTKLEYGFSRIFLSVLAGFALPFAVWFGLSSANCGGVSEYIDIVRGQFGVSVGGGKFGQASFRIMLGLKRLVAGLLLGGGAAILPAVAAIIVRPITIIKSLWESKSRSPGMFLIMIAFPVLFFVFVFLAKSGYVLILLPPTIVVSIICIHNSLLRGKTGFSTRLLLAVVIVDTAMALFLPASSYPRFYTFPGDIRQTYDRYIAANTLISLRDYERRMDEVTGPVQRDNPAGRTVLLLPYERGFFGLRHAQYYFENYPIIVLYRPGFKLYYNFDLLGEYEENAVVLSREIDRVLIISGTFDRSKLVGGELIESRRIFDIDIAAIENRNSITYDGFRIIRETP